MVELISVTHCLTWSEQKMAKSMTEFIQAYENAVRQYETAYQDLRNFYREGAREMLALHAEGKSSEGVDTNKTWRDIEQMFYNDLKNQDSTTDETKEMFRKRLALMANCHRAYIVKCDAWEALFAVGW